MNQVGFAVLKDRKRIVGMAGLGYEATKVSRDRYAKLDPSGELVVVPLFVGDPVIQIAMPDFPDPPTKTA